MPPSDPSLPSSGLLVLRHAQSTWNAAGRWQGWADPPLSDEGEGQVGVAAAVFRSAGVEAYQVEGYQLDGYRLDAPGSARVAPAAVPGRRSRQAPRERPAPR